MRSIKKQYSDRALWLNDKDELHHLDGPAVECINGHKEWYKNGELHREDGPAVEFTNNNKWWCLNGIPYTEEQYKTELIKLKLNRVKDL